MSVTIKQLAAEVGVSWSAISQILKDRGRFSEQTRQRVLETAARHGYRPNASARALRQQKSKLIGVVFRNAPDQPLTNMAAFEYLVGINHEFQLAEYETILIRAGELLDVGTAVGTPEPRVFRERLVDGIIVSGAFPDPVVERLARLSPRAIWLDSGVWTDACCLRRDEVSAGRTAAAAMVELGYKKITYISRDAAHSQHHSHAEREQGAAEAATVAGVEFEVIPWPEGDARDEVSCSQNVLTRDAALVVGSLPIARRIANLAASMGKVPGFDYGLVCCDDSVDSMYGWRNLSRVGFNRYALGGMAARMMLELLENPASPPVSRRVGSPWIFGNTAWGPGPFVKG